MSTTFENNKSILNMEQAHTMIEPKECTETHKKSRCSHYNVIEWIKQIIIILVTSFSTAIFTQMFYQKNAITTAQISMMMSQSHIYNKVHDICEYDSLMYVEFHAHTQTREEAIQVDRFGNYKGKKEILGKEIKLEHFKINAPSFMFIDEVYDKFCHDWSYIKKHQDHLTPEAYQIVNHLTELFNKYPLPAKEKRMQEIATHWSKESVYTQYYRYMDELQKVLEINYLKNQNNWK